MGRPSTTLNAEAPLSTTALDSLGVRVLLKEHYLVELPDQLTLDSSRSLNASPSGSVFDKIRKALDTPIKVNWPNTDGTIILRQIQETHGITFVISVRLPNVSIAFDQPVSLGAALQAIEDLRPAFGSWSAITAFWSRPRI